MLNVGNEERGILFPQKVIDKTDASIMNYSQTCDRVSIAKPLT